MELFQFKIMNFHKTSPLVVLVSLVVMVTCTPDDDSIYIDLSHPQSSTTIYWPGQPKFNRTVLQKGSNENNIWIEVGAFTSGEHGGTHIDAPRHFFQTGYDLKDLPIENTIADGVMIDAREEAQGDIDYQLTVEKLLAWEDEHGQIPNRAAVVVNFGWTSRWPDPWAFFGTTNGSNYTSFHFPTVSEDAAKWLMENRDFKILALDVPSPDGATDDTFPVHRLLLARNILIVENVMIPDSLPARGFRLHAAPIRIEGGTGVQTRVYAILSDATNSAHEFTWFYSYPQFLTMSVLIHYMLLNV